MRRILELKIRLGLLDEPYVDENDAHEVLADPAHRAAAAVAAQRSAVLLRNEHATLPLQVDQLGSIAVLGPLADSKRDTLGPGRSPSTWTKPSPCAKGSRPRSATPSRFATPRGCGRHNGPRRPIFDQHGGNRPEDPQDFDDAAEWQRAVELARASDVTVLVVGEWQNLVGEQAAR